MLYLHNVSARLRIVSFYYWYCYPVRYSSNAISYFLAKILHRSVSFRPVRLTILAGVVLWFIRCLMACRHNSSDSTRCYTLIKLCNTKSGFRNTLKSSELQSFTSFWICYLKLVVDWCTVVLLITCCQINLRVWYFFTSFIILIEDLNLKTHVLNKVPFVMTLFTFVLYSSMWRCMW